MTKALTPTNQNSDRALDLGADRSGTSTRAADFPSYFGNFGSFKPFLSFRGEARLSKRGLDQEGEFSLITAFMAIV